MPHAVDPAAAAPGGSHDFSDPEDDPCADARDDFNASPQWAEWLDSHDPASTPGTGKIPLILLKIDDVSDKSFIARRNPHAGFTLVVPVREFFTGEPQRDVYRRLFRELWVRAADTFGWPPPPELPPYQDSPSA